MNGMLSYMAEAVNTLERKLEQPGGATPRQRYSLELARLGTRLYDGHNVAWCGLLVPFDLLGAMGYTSCFVEFVGASLAASGMVGSFLERAEEDGLVPDMCGYHRAIHGAALAGVVPVPEVLIGTTCPCTAGQATMENLARHMERELMMLHVPLEETPEAVDYLAGQLRVMVAWLEEVSGRPYDAEAVAASIAHSNDASATMREVFDLAAHVPSPTNSRELKDFGIAMPLLFGRPEAVDVARGFRDAFRERVERGEGQGGTDERVRLLWVQNRIQFREPLVGMLEEELGAVIVADELNCVTWEAIDPRDPLPGIARRMISNPFNGPIETRITKLQQLARANRVHGAINPCNWGCRQGAGARGMMQQGLAEIGVPMLNLEVDCVDPRAFSEGQLRTRLEAFVEMLVERESPWS